MMEMGAVMCYGSKISETKNSLPEYDKNVTTEIWRYQDKDYIIVWDGRYRVYFGEVID